MSADHEPDENRPQVRVNRALRMLDQLTGVLGAAGVLMSAFVAVLIAIDRSNVKKSETVPVVMFMIVASVVWTLCVVLMISRYGINRNEQWAPRVARKISLALSMCAPVWLVLITFNAPVGPPVWRVLLLAGFTLLSLFSYELWRNLKTVIEMVDSLPAKHSGFDPIMRADPVAPTTPVDHGTDSVRAK